MENVFYSLNIQILCTFAQLPSSAQRGQFPCNIFIYSWRNFVLCRKCLKITRIQFFPTIYDHTGAKTNCFRHFTLREKLKRVLYKHGFWTRSVTKLRNHMSVHQIRHNWGCVNLIINYNYTVSNKFNGLDR